MRNIDEHRIQIAQEFGLKTEWGKRMFEAQDLEAALEEEYNRLSKYEHRVVTCFLEVFPLIAEYKAIQAFGLEYECLHDFPPLPSDVEEAIFLANLEHPLTNRQQEVLRGLLTNHLNEKCKVEGHLKSAVERLTEAKINLNLLEKGYTYKQLDLFDQGHELSDQIDEQRELVTKLESEVRQERILAKGIAVVKTCIQNGVYDIETIMEHLFNRSEGKFEKVFDSIKLAYLAAQLEVSDEIVNQMDAPKEVRALKIDDVIKKLVKIQNSGTSEVRFEDGLGHADVLDRGFELSSGEIIPNDKVRPIDILGIPKGISTLDASYISEAKLPVDGDSNENAGITADNHEESVRECEFPNTNLRTTPDSFWANNKMSNLKIIFKFYLSGLIFRRSDLEILFGDLLKVLIIVLIISFVLLELIFVFPIFFMCVAAILAPIYIYGYALDSAKTRMQKQIDKYNLDHLVCSHGIKEGNLKCQFCFTNRMLHEESSRQLEEDRRKKNIFKSAQDVRQNEARRIYIKKASLSDEIMSLSGRDFEILIGNLYKDAGFDVELTPASADKGFDLILLKSGIKYYVECKRYKLGSKVGRPELQKFYGAVIANDAHKGFFVTTSNFTQQAKEFAGIVSEKLELINGSQLKKLINSVYGDDIIEYVSVVCLECGDRIEVKFGIESFCSNGHLIATVDLNDYKFTSKLNTVKKKITPYRSNYYRRRWY